MSPHVRIAHEDDLAAVVRIYNSSIASRVATADLEEVTVESRRVWFREHRASQYPLWVIDGARSTRAVVGWVSLQRFHSRCAYHTTAEISVYVDAAEHRRGHGRALLAHALTEAPKLGLRTLVGLCFGHNLPSLSLFAAQGFAQWGVLPRVAELDGVERDLVYVGKRLL